MAGETVAFYALVVTALVAFLGYFGRRSYLRRQDKRRIMLNLHLCLECLSKMGEKWLGGGKEHVVRDRHFEYSDIQLDLESQDLFAKLERVRQRLRKKKDENRHHIVTPEFIKCMYQEREAFRNILPEYSRSRDLVSEIERIVFDLLANKNFPNPDIEIKSFFEQ